MTDFDKFLSTSSGRQHHPSTSSGTGTILRIWTGTGGPCGFIAKHPVPELVEGKPCHSQKVSVPETDFFLRMTLLKEKVLPATFVANDNI